MKNNSAIANKAIINVLGLVTFWILFRTAWLGDDSFITMRTVGNWINGFGLVWNVGERVQTFTHPLWMLLLSSVYFFSRNAYLTLLTVNITVSLTVIFIYIRQFKQDTFLLTFGWAILFLSKAFLDYSTSGLENGLTHLLLLVFVILFLRSESEITSKKILLLSFLAGLATTNRMDTVLFFIPALIYIWFLYFRNMKGVGILLTGFTPFLIWEVFSIFYYGFPFPNTAYAKLNSGVPQVDLFRQGILYIIDSFTYDPITLLMAGTTLLLAFSSKERREKALATGLALYLFYVLYIGGDFMTGRFFSAIFLLSAFLFTRHMAGIANQTKYVLFGVFIAAGLLSPFPTLKYFLLNPEPPYTIYALLERPYSLIYDERWGYAPATNPANMDRGMHMPRHAWAGTGAEYKANNESVVIEEGIGMLGVFAGPKVHVLDPLALGDPLLARIHIRPSYYWRIGHFKRQIPEGYFETLKIGKNKIKDQNLSEYYDKLKIIISGQLLSKERLITIWEMNTGKYNYLVDAYNATLK